MFSRRFCLAENRNQVQFEMSMTFGSLGMNIRATKNKILSTFLFFFFYFNLLIIFGEKKMEN